VTVDCGIASLQEARTARELGIELIITDHHEMKPSFPMPRQLFIRACPAINIRLPG
jgi:single-stranded DNA-specific DHH superfamily exonuclease